MESWYLASLQRTEVYLLYLELNFVGCEVWCHRIWVTKPSAMTWITQRSLSARRYHRNVMRCMRHDATVALRKGLSWGSGSVPETSIQVWLPKESLLDKYAGLENGEYASFSGCDLCKEFRECKVSIKIPFVQVQKESRTYCILNIWFATTTTLLAASTSFAW